MNLGQRSEDWSNRVKLPVEMGASVPLCVTEYWTLTTAFPRMHSSWIRAPNTMHMLADYESRSALKGFTKLNKITRRDGSTCISGFLRLGEIIELHRLSNLTIIAKIANAANTWRHLALLGMRFKCIDLAPTRTILYKNQSQSKATLFPLSRLLLIVQPETRLCCGRNIVYLIAIATATFVYSLLHYALCLAPLFSVHPYNKTPL